MGGATATMVCMPGETRSCYAGPDGTEGVGACKAGTETCTVDGADWEPCQGQITPQQDDPSAFGDEACDGYWPGETVCAGLFGGAEDQIVSAVAIDASSGAVVVTGAFADNAQFGDDILIGTGFNHVFVAKFNSICQPLWAIQLGGVADDYSRNIAVDNDGNVVVVGDSYGSLDIGGKTIPPSTFIAKFSGATGANIWATGCGGSLQSTLYALGLDSNGNVFIGGSFFGSADCGNGPLPSSGATDAVLAQLTAGNGSVVWAKRFGTDKYEGAGALAVDGVGNVIVTGGFGTSINFGGPNLTSGSTNGTFVAKLSSNGSYIWANALGSGFKARAIAVDKFGASILAGEFASPFDLPGVGMFTPIGQPDGMVLKLDASGNAVWGRGFGDEGYQLVSRVAVDSAENVVLGGLFEGTMDLAGGILTASGKPAYQDIFAAKFAGNTGMHIWSADFGDANFAPTVAMSAKGDLIIAGTASEPLNFGSGPLDPAGYDAFVALLAP